MRTPLLAAVCALAAAAAACTVPVHVDRLLAPILCAACAAIAVYDLRERRIPEFLTLPLGAAALVDATVTAHLPQTLKDTALIALPAIGLFFAAHAIVDGTDVATMLTAEGHAPTPDEVIDPIGMGDVTFTIMLAASLGLATALIALVAGVGTGLLVGATAQVVRGPRTIPLGSYLAAGTLATVLVIRP